MARGPVKPQPVNKDLSAQEMQATIPKIDRRIADLEAFDTQTITRDSNPNLHVLEREVETLLSTIYGPDSFQYQRYRHITRFYRGGTISLLGGPPTPLSETQKSYGEGIEEAIATLKSIKKGFLEELDDAGASTSGRALRAYDGLDLHPEIARAASKLFRDGHYSNAIEDAVKALTALVRLRSGIENKDGQALMQHVFSPNNPILKFNDLKDHSDQDEQKGFMMMFAGAVAALRNPRAHRLVQDDPELALESIAFVSLLAKLLDDATRD